jgi:outer membrane translocation and assembly module TamA
VTGGYLLGGDNGLRGYPLRYQSGSRRALFTAEERFYTDVYLWRLFRVGGAAFVDVGRAWGGDNINTANPGWLSNVGFGLRFVSVRSAFGNVLHMDIAMPLNTTADISKVQFLVKSKSSF